MPTKVGFKSAPQQLVLDERGRVESISNHDGSEKVLLGAVANGVTGFTTDPTSLASHGAEHEGMRAPQLYSRIGRNFVAIGHSITADAAQQSVANVQTWGPWGYLTWFRRFLGQRIVMPMSSVLAVPGVTVAQVRSGQLAPALALNPDVLIIECGVNSITPAGAADTVAQANATFLSMQADYLAMIQAARAKGIFTICIGVRCRSTPTLFTTIQAQLAERFNRWIKTVCKQDAGCLWYDPNPYYLDYSTGYAVTSLLRDGTHDTVASARLMGKGLADLISTLLPNHYDLLDMKNGPYDSVSNPTGALLTNGLLSGAVSISGGGTVTGTAPTGWNIYSTKPAGTVTVACSTEMVSGYTNLPRQIFTFGGTGDGATIQMQQTQAIPGNVAIGDWVVFEMLLDINLGAGFQQVGININGRDTSYVSYSQSWDGFPNVSSYGTLAAVSDTGLLFRTEPIQIKTGATVLDTFLQIIAPASGSVSGTVKASLSNCYKVNIN